MPDLNCKYVRAGRCTNRLALPISGATPSAGVCARCEHRNGIRGVGDLVALLIGFTPFKRLECGACFARQAFLNRIGWRRTPNKLDCARSRAWNRLRSSRNPQVRDAANDLLAFSGTFRSFRYLSSAPMSEIEILASHPSIRRNHGR